MRTRRLTALAAAALAVGLALTGCSKGDVIAQSAPAQSGGVPNLDATRIDEVLQDTTRVLDESQSAGDPTPLSQRLAGAALEMRTAQYAVAKATKSSAPTLDLTSQVLTVTNTGEWPRTMIDISRAPEGGVPSVYWFTQADARSPYMLTNWTRLLGGTSLTTMSVQVGTDPVAPDASGFVMTPTEALRAWVDMLNSGTAGSERFTADEFTRTWLDDVKHLSDSVQAAGKVTAHAEVSDIAPTGVLLHDGSALVAGTITYTHTYARTIAKSTMKLGGTSAAVAGGDPSVVGTVTVKYLANVLIVVPTTGAEGSSLASVVGVEKVMTGVTRDDSAKPEGE